MAYYQLIAGWLVLLRNRRDNIILPEHFFRSVENSLKSNMTLLFFLSFLAQDCSVFNLSLLKIRNIFQKDFMIK